MRLGYDWRGQRFSRFPDPNGDSHAYPYANGYANCDTNSYGDGNRNSNRDTDSYSKCHCNTDWFTSPQNATYANTAASPDTSASPVGPCISSDTGFGLFGIVDAAR